MTSTLWLSLNKNRYQGIKVQFRDTVIDSSLYDILIVKVTLRQTGNTPALVNKTFWVQRNQTVRWVVEFIKQQLKCQPHESLVSITCVVCVLTSLLQFVYVQQAFAPSLDQDINTLYEVVKHVRIC